MNLTSKTITLIAATLAVAAAIAQTPYDEGQKALRDQRWMEAARQFEAAQDGDQADAAMYWRAHALYKAGHRGDAARQIRELEREYPDSRWVREAQALQIEHQGSPQDAVIEDELRIFALSRLMERDLERALPLVIELLNETESGRARQDALFVLGMSDAPEARAAIARVARDGSDPELQSHAIGMLGVAGNDASLALLESLYTDTNDRRVREAVIHAHIAHGKPGPLVNMLEAERDPELQADLIRALGIMDATDTLNALYPTLDSPHARIAAVEAFSLADDTEALRHILESETDPELRATAIQGIAIGGDERAEQWLAELYSAADSREEKMSILESLVILGEGEALALRVVREETDPDIRRNAIQLLGVMEATEELGGLYDSLSDTDTRRAVLEAMAIAGDDKGLRRVLDSETDSDLRVEAIEAIAVSDTDDAGAYLTGHYATATPDEKKAVINAMLILDDVPGLVALLEGESDPAMRREMLQMLAVMDSDEADDYLFDTLENER